MRDRAILLDLYLAMTSKSESPSERFQEEMPLSGESNTSVHAPKPPPRAKFVVIDVRPPKATLWRLLRIVFAQCSGDGKFKCSAIILEGFLVSYTQHRATEVDL